MKTGKDMGLFGGFLAVVLGYFFIAAGISLIQYGTYPSPVGMFKTEIQPEPLGVLGIYILVAGTACIVGGILGFIGGCLADRKTDNAGALMVAGGCLAAFSVVGMLSSAVLAAGSMRAFRFAGAPPDTEPEWADGEELPY